MSEKSFPPPAYEEIHKTSIPQNADPEWQEWYRKMIALKFTQEEAGEYAGLFVANDVEINMIPELNDGVLKSIGIEKAGHRIRILHLQNNSSTQTLPSVVAAAQLVANAPMCACHPNIVANEKCHKCYRLVCLDCRREKVNKGYQRYYCQTCYEEDCTIL